MVDQEVSEINSRVGVASYRITSALAKTRKRLKGHTQAGTPTSRSKFEDISHSVVLLPQFTPGKKTCRGVFHAI